MMAPNGETHNRGNDHQPDCTMVATNGETHNRGKRPCTQIVDMRLSLGTDWGNRLVTEQPITKPANERAT